MSLLRKISLSFIFIILGSFLAYLFRRMLALHLSVSDYGLIYALIGFFSFFMLFIDMGLEQAATKYIVEYRLQNNLDSIRSLAFSVLGFQLFCSFILFLFVFFCSHYLAISYFHTPAAAEYLIMLGVWFCTSPLIMFISYLLLGFQRTTWYTAIDFFRMLFLFGGGFILLSYHKGIYAPLLMYALVNIVLFCFYLPYVFSFFPTLIKKTHLFSWTLFSEVFSYGILIALTSFGWIIITQTDTLMLTYLKTPYEVGLYAVALPISLILLFFMRPIIIVFAPLVAESAAAKKHKELSQTISTAYKYAFMLLVPLVLCFILFPDLLISLLFSQKYLPATHALQILAVGTLFYSFSLFNSIIFNGLGKAKTMAIVVALVSILNIFLNLFFIPLYSITGAALSTSISYILLFILSTYYQSTYIPVQFPLKTWIASGIAAVLTVALVFVIKYYLVWNNLGEALFCGGILFGVYTALLFLMRAVTYAEIHELFISKIKGYFQRQTL